jgi:hypothetical protein
MIRPFPKPHLPKANIARLLRRRRVTLIASIPTPKGFAICADSQETVVEQEPDTGEQYEVRCTVQKIAPLISEKYQIGICGGGHAGLIEAFIVKAKRALEDEDSSIHSAQNPASIKRIHSRMEQELGMFYATDVALCPDPPSTKGFKLFIAASCPLAQECAVWVSENTVLRESRTDGPELNGWNHRLYEHTARRLFSLGMTLTQASLAAIYTVAVAKNTSNYVRDPFSLAIVDGNGIHLMESEYITAMESRLQEYEARLNSLFLACADTTVSNPELEDSLGNFNEAILQMHKDQIDTQAQSMTIEDLLGRNPQRKLPKGPVYIKASGALQVEHDREKIAASRKKFEFIKIQGGDGPVILTVRCKCSRISEVEFPNYQTIFGKPVECPCGEKKIITEIAQPDIRLKFPSPDLLLTSEQREREDALIEAIANVLRPYRDFGRSDAELREAITQDHSQEELNRAILNLEMRGVVRKNMNQKWVWIPSQIAAESHSRWKSRFSKSHF